MLEVEVLDADNLRCPGTQALPSKRFSAEALRRIRDLRRSPSSSGGVPQVKIGTIAADSQLSRRIILFHIVLSRNSYIVIKCLYADRQQGIHVALRLVRKKGLISMHGSPTTPHPNH